MKFYNLGHKTFETDFNIYCLTLSMPGFQKLAQALGRGGGAESASS